MGKSNIVRLDGNSLTISDLFKISSGKCRVEIDEVSIRKAEKSHKIVREALLSSETIYGITTGFGSLENKRIDTKSILKLQENILMSHALGTGEPYSREIVKAIIALRLNTLLKGYSGVSVELIKSLNDLLNSEVIPFVPSKGSVGASGDLCPLAHIGLVLIGKGKAYFRDKLIDGAIALRKANLKPYRLKAKEGLAITNGTTVMSALLALACHESERLLKLSLCISALSLEAFLSISSSFTDKISEVRPHKGQRKISSSLKNMLKNSRYIDSADLSKIEYDKINSMEDKQKAIYRVQDSYSLRCIPVVLGASYDAIEYVKNIVGIEINSATDNPLIFPDTREIISACNFHGQPLAISADFLAIAISEIGNISERRLAKLLDCKNNYGLLAYLINNGGLNSGYMISQYTAASLASENKVLCHPASCDSIPTSANQEDHVSMGNHAARKIHQVLENVWAIIALEYLASAQAVDLRGGEKKLSPFTRKIYNSLRDKIYFLENDREMHKDLETCINILKDTNENSLYDKIKDILDDK